MWKKQLSREGFVVEIRVRTAKRVARELLQLAKDEECSMVAMATHGWGGLDRMMLGSVTDQVLRHTDVPVLVLRPEVKYQTEGESLAGGTAGLPRQG